MEACLPYHTSYLTGELNMKHRFGDQYARFESIKTYLHAAMNIAKEALESQKEAHESPISDDELGELIGDIGFTLTSTVDLIDAIAGEAAIEGAEKDTLLPPPARANSRPTEPKPFKPVGLVEIDPPFEDLRS